MSERLSAIEVKALREIFDEFNTSEDAWLDINELQDFLKKAGLESSRRSVYKIIAAADKDADGKIDFNELCDYISYQRTKDGASKQQFSTFLDLKMDDFAAKYKLDRKVADSVSSKSYSDENQTQAYHQFDEYMQARIMIVYNKNKGHDGFLDVFQFMAALKEVGDFTQGEMCSLVVKADQDGDTAIDFNEFITMLWSNRERLTIGKEDDVEDARRQIAIKSSVVNSETREIPDEVVKTDYEQIDKMVNDDNPKVDEEKGLVEIIEKVKAAPRANIIRDDKSLSAENYGLDRVGYFTILTPSTQAHVLTISVKCLKELEKLSFSNDEQLDFFTRLIVAQRRQTNSDFISNVVI